MMGLLLLGVGAALVVATDTANHTQAVNNLLELIYELASAGYEQGYLMYALALANIALYGELIRRALRDAARWLKKTLRKIRKKIKIFPIFRSIMPAIFSFKSSYLLSNPRLALLTYNGPGSPRTTANRRWVRRTYGHLRATVPIFPAYQLDEYPYASSLEGGFPFARARMVPATQNMAEGTALSVFVRGPLRSRGGSKYMVVPVPF